MSRLPLVLSDDEYKEFLRPGRAIPRRVARLTPEGGQEAPVELKTHLEADFTRLLGREGGWFQGWCIAVHDGDGAKWSAEAVAAVVAERFPQFKLWPMAGRPAAESLPAIAHLTGGRLSFLALAARQGLAPRFFTLRSPFSVLALLAALFLGFVVQAATALQKSVVPGPDALTQPGFYVLPAIIGASLFVLAYLTSRLTAFTPEKSEEKFLDSYEANRRSASYEKLVDALVARLRWLGFPRVVVVGRFERLDVLTQDVVVRYLKRLQIPPGAEEFWLVFEGRGGATLGAAAFEHHDAPGFRNTQFFELKVLEERQRRELSRNVHGDERAAHFTTVREICRGAGDVRLYDRLAEYRRLNPAPDPLTTDSGYGPLDVLHLVALTAEPGQYPLETAFLASVLSTAEPQLRHTILTLFLRSRRIVKTDIERAVTAAGAEFPACVIIEGTGRKQTIRATSEAATTLARHHQGLALRKPELGHLYWAVFWYERRRVFEAFWVRQLSRHLLAAGLSDVHDEPTYQSLLQRLFEAGLFAVEGCLKTSLFRDVRALLRVTWNHLEVSPPESRARRPSRLLRLCWEAYSVLGDEEILRLILEIDGRAAVADIVGADPLERLYFESVSFSGDRAQLRPSLLYPGHQQPSTRESIADYCRIRAGWFALTMIRLWKDDSPSSVIGTALRAIDEQRLLAQAITAACARAEKDDDDRSRIADLIAVSLGIWCQALEARLIAGNLDMWLARTAPTDAEPRARASQVRRTALRGVADIAETAMLLSDALRGESRRPSPIPGGTTNFLRDVFAREISAIALAAVLMAYRHLAREAEDVDDALWSTIEGTFRFAADRLAYALPAVTKESLRADALPAAIDELLQLCGVMWRKLDLDTLAAFNGIRRLQFDPRFPDAARVQEATVEPLADAIGPSLTSGDVAGVIANVTIAESLTAAAVAAARHLRAAAAATLRGGFGDRLKSEMSLAAVLHSHTFPCDLTPFAEAILVSDVAGGDYLSAFLRSTNEAALGGHVMALTNACGCLARPELRLRILSAVEAMLPDIGSAEIRQEVRSILEMTRLEQQVRLGEGLDGRALLTTWADRKTLWLYPVVLRLLIEVERDAVAREEALALLRRDPLRDPAITYLYLALTLLEERIQRTTLFGDFHVPLSYLQGSVERWTARLPVQTNIRAYQVLHRLDSAHAADHSQRLQEWLMRRIREEHLTTLPALVERGRLFLVFREYVRSMSHWGLRPEVVVPPLAERIRYDAGRKRDVLREWRQHGAVLSAFVSDAAGPVLSAQFLCLGEYLFTEPIDTEPAFHELREEFDRTAQRALPALLDMIGGLPELPPLIREVFERHSRRLLEYSTAS